MTKVWTKGEALQYLYDNSVETASGCREWTGSLNSDGYGQLSCETLFQQFRIKGVHRLMLFLLGHELQGRQTQTLHSCDNRRCCAPRHLSTGTAAENGRDRAERSEYRGSKTPQATIDETIAARIKHLLRSTKLRHQDIAETLGVGVKVVNHISSGRTWRHVDV